MAAETLASTPPQGWPLHQAPGTEAHNAPRRSVLAGILFSFFSHLVSTALGIAPLWTPGMRTNTSDGLAFHLYANHHTHTRTHTVHILNPCTRQLTSIFLPKGCLQRRLFSTTCWSYGTWLQHALPQFPFFSDLYIIPYPRLSVEVLFLTYSRTSLPFITLTHSGSVRLISDRKLVPYIFWLNFLVESLTYLSWLTYSDCTSFLFLCINLRFLMLLELLTITTIILTVQSQTSENLSSSYKPHLQMMTEAC